MKYYFLIALFTFTTLVSGQEESTVQTETTTYYLIRHAEKDKSDTTNRNPHLNDKGKVRAEAWAETFKNIKFDAVYSTDYFRTKETATPTAKANNLEITLYSPRGFDSKKFIADTKGKIVLIVGHSNTTPFFTNTLLGDKKYTQISETNNSNLYIVTIGNDVKTSTLLSIN